MRLLFILRLLVASLNLRWRKRRADDAVEKFRSKCARIVCRFAIL